MTEKRARVARKNKDSIRGKYGETFTSKLTKKKTQEDSSLFSLFQI